MVGIISCKRLGIETGLFITILAVSMAHQETQAFFSIDIDTAMFNGSLKAAKYSLRFIVKTLISSPKMIALILSIYFYKEIFGFAKDVVGYAAGEFPKISLAASLCALFYASTCHAPEEEIPS